MPEATNAQMQAYCDQRLRPFAEAFRAVYIAALDHKAANDDVYARAIGASRWDDARTDGPPHLLASGGNASPDDIEVFNSFITALIAVVQGSGESDAVKAGYVNTLRSEWTVLQDACVRPVLESEV